MRELQVVDVSDPRSLMDPLRLALFEGGPAVLPRPGGAKITATAPREVPDEVAVVIETSGSTGAPKRVALSAEAVVHGARSTSDALGAPGTWLLVLPAQYIAGVQVMVRSLLAGTTPIVLHPEPFSTAALAARHAHLASIDSPVYTAMVPAQLQRILDDAETMVELHALMTRCDRILVGGQAIPDGVVERSARAGYAVTRTYGSAETAGGCVWDGKPLEGVQVAEFEGRIAISGGTLAHSYLDDPRRTAQSFVERDGTRWYLSDDAGSLDEHGILRIAGRLDDVIVSGGVKVALGEIERVVHTDFQAHEAVVVSDEHEVWGHVPVVVTTKDLDLVALRLALGSACGPEARPDRVLRVREIPMLASGKPDRLAVRELVKASRS